MLKTLSRLARARGADLTGWAAFDRGELALYSLLSPQQARQYHSALVIAKRHRPEALENLQGVPTRAYDADYRRLNSELYDLVLHLEAYLKNRGVACLAVKPSETLDTARQRGLISHRALALRAGLGVRGRNNLLVTVQFRSRLRLAALLTELSVARVPKPVWPYPCQQCNKCQDACPAGALGDAPEDFRLDLCLAHLERVRTAGLSPQICGVCLVVCPETNSAIGHQNTFEFTST